MGYENRDYAYGSQPGIHLQSPQSVTMKLVLITVGVYALQNFVESFSSQFVLYADWFREPWRIYSLLSYGFLHDTGGVQHILLNMVMLWMFGTEIERKYGQREYLLFYLWAIVFAGLFWSISESSVGRAHAALLGASGGISALFVLFALNFPHRRVLFMFFIPMPMWVVAMIGLGYDIFGSIYRTESNVAFTAHLAGAVAGLYYYKFGFSPFAWVADKFSGKRFKPKPNLKLHTPIEDDEPEVDLREEEILKKIHEQGQDSLTRSERRYLEKISAKYRQRRT